MTEHTRSELKHLQHIDNGIHEARQRILDFDPLFAEVEEPALALSSEVTTARSRLQEMKLEERRLELSVEEKRVRIRRLEERLGGVRNLREEAAVSAELDMVRRALQSDEQEAYTLIDQIRKQSSRLTELEASLSEAQAQVDPRMKGLEAERKAAMAELARREEERAAVAQSVDPRQLKLYEGIRAGGKRQAVAELTADGACGHCFGVVPLQLQNEVRHGRSVIRCEQCGVILAAPSAGEGAGPREAGAAPGE